MRQFHFLVLGLAAAVCSASAGAAQPALFGFLAQSDAPDGVKRVLTLDSEQTAANGQSVVFVIDDGAADGQHLDGVAEQLAQMLDHAKDSAATATATTVFKTPGVGGPLKDAQHGQVFVYRSGHRYAYHGLRDAATIIRFVRQACDGAAVKNIAGKLDKVAFDHHRGVKLVGFFDATVAATVGAGDATAAARQAFDQAAALFGTQVAFYTVTDPLVAKHLKMNATGQVYLFRGEFDHKQPVVCPSNPATLADIQQLIVLNRDQLVKVTPFNVLDPALTATASAAVLVTDSTSPLSFHLLKLLARSKRQPQQQQAATTTTTAATSNAAAAPAALAQMRLLWVDTADFPALSVDHRLQPAAAATSALPVPGLGYWDASTQTVHWMDLTTLNAAPADRVQEEANQLLVRAFLLGHHKPAAPPARAETAAPKAEL